MLMRDSEKTEQKKAIREIRINPIVPTESVLVATARSMRPKKEEPPVPHDARPYVEACPFCTGNEDKTPAPIAVFPREGAWQIRIVENMFPVLGDDKENPNFAFGLQQAIDGYGRHEVIIDNPSHGIRIHEMTDEHLEVIRVKSLLLTSLLLSAMIGHGAPPSNTIPQCSLSCYLPRK